MRIPTKAELMQGTDTYQPSYPLFYQTNLGGVDTVLSDLTTSPKVTFRATQNRGERLTRDFDSFEAAVDFLLQTV